MIKNSKSIFKSLTAGLFILAFGAGCTGCVSVETYQKMYLNDKEMELNARHVEYFEINNESYREGASGVNGGKVGGGCGCY